MLNRRWLQYGMQRLAATLPILASVVVFTFVLMRLLPGDPATYFISSPNAGPVEIQALRVKLGLDRSLAEQLVIYVGDLFQGNMGYSLTTGQPVAKDILARLPASMELTAVAFLLVIIVSIPLGVAAATKPNSFLDHVSVRYRNLVHQRFRNFQF